MSTSLIKGGVILIKILKKGILAVVMTALILTLSPLTAFSQEYKPRLTSPNGEPYYTSKLNVYSQTGYGMPNCVAYAYGRLYELNGEAPKLNRVMQVNGGVSIKETVIMITVTLPKGVQ